MIEERLCVRCGKFIGNRRSHAKYCRECSHEMDNVRERLDKKRAKENGYILHLNEMRDGHWILSEEYLDYQRVGGYLSPEKWNEAKRELYYGKKKHEVAKRKE